MRDWLDLIGAFARDAATLRTYCASLDLDARDRELRRAMNDLPRTRAFEQARAGQSAFRLRLFLQELIVRPVPPSGCNYDPEFWNALREQLRKQLEMLGGPVEGAPGGKSSRAN